MIVGKSRYGAVLESTDNSPAHVTEQIVAGIETVSFVIELEIRDIKMDECHISLPGHKRTEVRCDLLIEE